MVIITHYRVLNGLNFDKSPHFISLNLACECYVMSKYAFKDGEMFGVIEWAVQAYNKWLVDQPSCLNIEKLLYYIKSASIFTGITVNYYYLRIRKYEFRI